jgi:hypothetical protein
MDNTALSLDKLKLYIVTSIFSLVGGYIYVMAMGTSYRGIIFVNGMIVFFAGAVLFLRYFKKFLIFSLLFGLAFYYGYYLIYNPPHLEAPPFAVGIRLDATDIPLIIGYIYWGMNLASHGGTTRPITIGGKVGGLFFAWVCFIFVSGLMEATDVTYSLYEGIVYVKGFLFYFYLINNITDLKDLRIVIYGLCGAGLIESLVMIVQFAVKKNFMIQAYYQISFGGGPFRSVGFLSHPDACIILMATVFPILVVGMFMVKSLYKKIAITSSAVSILVAAGLSQTRIAILIFGIGAAVALIISYKRGWISKGQIMLAAGSVPIMATLFIPLAYQRFVTAEYGEERWPLAVTAYRVFKSHFLMGVGPSNYNFVVNKYIPAQFAGKWVFTVHVEYLLRLAETGFLGFLIFCSLLILVTSRFYKATFTKNRLIFLLSCGLFSAMCASFVHRLTSIYHVPQVFYLMCSVYALSVTVGLLEKSLDSQGYPQELT